MSTIEHYVALVQPYLGRYGYMAVFVGVFVEGFGIPAPGETLVIASALLASHGEMSIAVLGVAWIAAVMGDNVGYVVGRFGARRFVTRYGDRTAPRMRKVECFFARYGGAIVVAARFFEGLRQLNGIVAGSIGMPWLRFLAFNAVGAALWVGVWGIGVYVLGENMGPVHALFARLKPYIVGSGLTVLLALLVYLFLGRHRQQS